MRGVTRARRFWHVNEMDPRSLKFSLSRTSSQSSDGKATAIASVMRWAKQWLTVLVQRSHNNDERLESRTVDKFCRMWSLVKRQRHSHKCIRVSRSLPKMSSHLYEVALFGEFFSHDLKAILNRITLHSESSHPMHSREIVFEPLEWQFQRDAGVDPVLLRAKKELTEANPEWRDFLSLASLAP
jgi:hypothetical protein